MGISGKIRVAITGNIGSGKTTFASFISRLGYPVILADDISKEILAEDPVVRREVIKDFGEQSFEGDKINKKFIADKIFSDKKNLLKINSILHPRVREKIESLSRELFKKTDIVFVEAALIYESKIEKMYDYIVLITADKEIRMKRSAAGKKLSKYEFNKRERNQLSEHTKMQKADFIFSNNGSKNDLKQKALLLVKLLKSVTA